MTKAPTITLFIPWVSDEELNIRLSALVVEHIDYKLRTVDYITWDRVGYLVVFVRRDWA